MSSSASLTGSWLAQRHCAASPTAVMSDPAGNDFADWKHLTQHSCGSTWMRTTAKSSIERVIWIAFVACCSWFAQRSRNPRRCGSPSSRYHGVWETPFVSPELSTIQAHTMPSMPHSSTAKRYRDTTRTARIVTHAETLDGEKSDDNQSLRGAPSFRRRLTAAPSPTVPLVPYDTYPTHG
jgi:hypothetical protein